MTALYRLFLRSQLVRGRILGLGVLGLLAILLGAAVGSSDGADMGDGARLVSGYGLSLFVPVTVLVFASAVLGDPNEDGTFVYLWLRPVARWRMAVAALAATLTITVPLVVVPMAVSGALAGGRRPGDLVLGAIASCTLATVAYAAIFTWLGLRVRRALVWGLAYILIWEGFVARAGATPSRLSVRSSSRSILGHVADGPRELVEAGVTASLVVPLAAAVIAVALTVRRLSTQDVA
ncbi:MAG: ABC transporter permease [Acidimicrobiales bacterium]